MLIEGSVLCPEIFQKAMLIEGSVLRPEIFQILSASQAKKNTQKKNHRTHKVEFCIQWHN